MELSLNMFLIAFIVFLIFESGFIESLKSGIAHLLNTKPEYLKQRPFFCRICMTFWTNIIYLIWIKELSLPTLCMALIYANTTDIIEEVYYTLKGLIMRLLKILN